MNFPGFGTAIQIVGLEREMPCLAFRIQNFNDFHDWFSEKRWHSFDFIKEPFDFATMAMFEILNGL